MEYETLSDLNALAQATDGLSKADMERLGAVVMLAEPTSAVQIKNLTENLDAFYDYEKYGTERMNEEDGMFTDRGYVAYKGFFRMEEVMENRHKNGMEMGGLSR